MPNYTVNYTDYLWKRRNKTYKTIFILTVPINMGGFGVDIINTLSSIVKLQVRFPLVQQNSCKSSESSAEHFDNGMYVDM